MANDQLKNQHEVSAQWSSLDRFPPCIDDASKKSLVLLSDSCCNNVFFVPPELVEERAAAMSLLSATGGVPINGHDDNDAVDFLRVVLFKSRK